ncbi:hypothetical protein AUEXF2481DRAFT_24620 [Aureobasidium subglaciale EXF-2481]|uniref:Mitochondrial outer membrane protein porin n=1 Tax=Aureobasidium subglaciale (strain EXF-2481) TaxID=1043005 RepID=A0A074Z1S3_AURSE|nr:uncharacterized protein AUEXF2481DRAFT_24620 [Aureobasidium subglaciale EXF-2481]KAI5212178.1 hypothetical protein E4T38_00707 [Aureobasidium subglaciale]KAI5231252.1 hypothetical protein E4T40_00708 [Aureobasidium subglaciale]KAI5234163.1 hypothetical protein E4T41_00706 [Aureobasidium subglaciale]KAI5267696.1 hypothetical protein E4T46_00706 [Aureobasidium subglaciale]KER00273.1 hypothetical protein AUEXF2481DRAFT_24620 [Aureobasidium subglaciale EXF-2481]
MAAPDFSDISKPLDGRIGVSRVIAMPLPAYGDLSKAANDRDSANLEVKLKAPNGANVTVKGKQAFDGATTASLEGKYTLKPQGTHFLKQSRIGIPFPVSARQSLYLMIVSAPVAQKAGTSDEPRSLSTQHLVYLTYHYKPGITVTQGWTTAALLDTKVEFASLMSQPVKAEFQNLFNPNAPSKAAQKLNLTFKQPSLHARAFLDHSAAGNINALIDATVGHEGFVAGAEAGYDVSKAAITRYSAGLGYQAPTFTASLIAMQNLSVLAASYYQKVNSNVEAGAKATYDLQGGKSVGLEVASKYKLDPLSFAKAKINDRGIAALAYNTKLNAGTTFGVGLSLDTNKLNEAGHKIGTSFVFEG